MNQELNDPELLQDFITESREHLDSIEPALLQLEKDPHNEELLNAVFRPIHSMKGAAGFLGLEHMSRLAHQAENVLDDLRKGRIGLSAEMTDAVLAVSDALRGMLDSLESGGSDESSVDIDTLCVTLSALTGGSATTVSTPGACPDQPSSPPAHANVSSALSAGNAVPHNVARQPVAASAGGKAKPAERYALHCFSDAQLHEFANTIADAARELRMFVGQEKGAVRDNAARLVRVVHALGGDATIAGFGELAAVCAPLEALLTACALESKALSEERSAVLKATGEWFAEVPKRIDLATASVMRAPIEPLLSMYKVLGVKIPQWRDAPEASLLKGDAEAESNGAVAFAGSKPDAVQHEAGSASTGSMAAYAQAVHEALEQVHAALRALAKNGFETEAQASMQQAFKRIETLSQERGLEEISVYAGRTAGLVRQAREASMNFDVMVDLLRQESEILADMTAAVLQREPPQDPDASVEKLMEPEHSGLAASKPLTGSDDEGRREDAEKNSKRNVFRNAASSSTIAGGQNSNASGRVVPDASSPPSEGFLAISDASSSGEAGAHMPSAKSGTGTIRVEYGKLDHLMNLTGELIGSRNRYAALTHAVESGNLKGEHVVRSLTEATTAMSRVTDELQDGIMKVRMVPVSSLFGRFQRMVRELARQSGKEVELLVEGEETEVDKSVAEAMVDPLVHLIRNAVDHGIEPPEDRKAAGKPAQGKVTLRAYHQGSSMCIEVEDDGAGMDPKKILRSAVRKGVVSEEKASLMNEREALELIFAPGFSSAERVTDISGRGVGMDVVRASIKSLKGSIGIYAMPGKGSRFTLLVPLTMAIIDALTVSAGGEVFAIPLDAVAETSKVAAARVTMVNGFPAAILRSEVLGLVRLRDVLGMPRVVREGEGAGVLPLVIITDRGRRLGIVVDALREREELVVKSLGRYLAGVRIVSGASIMGDGSIALILDPQELFRLATVQGRQNLKVTRDLAGR